MHPTEQLTVTLTAQEWNSVMALLGEQPFRVSAPLIGQIQQQCEQQAQLAQLAQPPQALMPQQVPNGAAQRKPPKGMPMRVVEPALTGDEPAA